MSKQKHFLLLRGLTRESRHWGNFPELLKKQYPSSEMILLDLPGAGVSYKEKAPLSVKEMVLKLRTQVNPEFLEKGQIVMVGVSLGGMISMKWAELFPQDLDSIVVVNSSAGCISPVWKRIKPTGLATLIYGVLRPEKQHEIIFNRVCRKKENRDHLISLWKKIHSENPVSVDNAKRQIIAAALFSLKKPLSVKGLVVTSMGDDLVNSECSKGLARFLNYPLEIHPWAGHELPDDDPEWVLEKVKNFVN